METKLQRLEQEFADLTAGWNIPEGRRKDYRWLGRNIGIKNKANILGKGKLDTAKQLIISILKEMNRDVKLVRSYEIFQFASHGSDGYMLCVPTTGYFESRTDRFQVCETEELAKQEILTKGEAFTSYVILPVYRKEENDYY